MFYIKLSLYSYTSLTRMLCSLFRVRGSALPAAGLVKEANSTRQAVVRLQSRSKTLNPDAVTP